MSLVGKRTAIAQALSGVAGVSGYPVRPVAPNVGDAWPLLGPLERAAGTAFEVSWLVRVMVPQDDMGACEWWDAHWPHLFEALEPLGSVDRATPGSIVVSGADQLVFEILFRTEE